MTPVPAQMRALLMTGVGSLALDEAPAPRVRPGWGVARVIGSAVGLFHSQMLNGMLDTGGLPRILGHEIVGEVMEASSPASPQPGSLVVVDAVVGCGVCEWCMRGEESICPWMTHLGIDLDGGFADYVAVPESNMFPLPGDVPISEAVMLSSALPAAVHAVSRSGVSAGDRALVSGVGSIGATVSQVVRAFGATTVIAADVSSDQLQAVASWTDGLVDVSGLTPGQAAEEVRRLAGAPHGVDIAFETAGHLSSVDAAIRALRPGGTAVMMGIVDGATSIGFQDYLGEFVRREVRLVTTFGFTRKDFRVGNAIYLAGALDLTSFAGNTYQLEDLPEALADIAEHGTGGKRHIVEVGSPIGG